MRTAAVLVLADERTSMRPTDHFGGEHQTAITQLQNNVLLYLRLGSVLTKKKSINQPLNWIELNLDLVGQKMNNQEGIFIVGLGEFDSIQLTKQGQKHLS